MGDRERAEKTAGELLDFGKRQANIRCQVMGHYVQGLSLLIAGDFPTAERAFRQATEVALDPLYSQFPAFMLGLSLIEQDQIEQAERVLNDVLSFCQEFGFTQLGMPAVSFLALIAAKQGRLGQGLKGLEEALSHYKTVGRRAAEMIGEYMQGRFYLEVLKAKGQVGLGTMARNVGFIVKNASAADKRGIEHLNRAVELNGKQGTFGFLGPSYLALAEIHAHKGAMQEARDYFQKAVETFEKCRADVYLAKAREEIAELDKSESVSGKT
jgi:tetratricopeptide (TPR) repeat protein